jgi:hypothetical protein
MLGRMIESQQSHLDESESESESEHEFEFESQFRNRSL